MKCTVLAVLMSVVVMGFAGSAGAVLLYYEGFAYPEGALAPQGGWVNQWDPDAMVVAPGLSYPGLTSSGNAVEAQGGGHDDYDPAIGPLFSTHGTYYITALLSNINQAPQFSFSTGTGHIVYSYLDTGNQSVLYVQKSDPHVEAIVPSGQTYSAGEPHLFAIRVINQDGPDDVRLVVDPTLPGEPDWESYDVKIDHIDITTSATTLVHVRGNPSGAIIDELRLTDFWVPEPATLCLFGLGGLALLRRRR